MSRVIVMGMKDVLSMLLLPVPHHEPIQAEIFYFKEVTAAPVTLTHGKKYIHTDPILSEVINIS